VSEVFRIGGLSAGAARVHASVCRVGFILDCGAVEVCAVVELVCHIVSFFFFFLYCCGDVSVVVVAVISCGMCIMWPSCCHMLDLHSGCDWNVSQ